MPPARCARARPSPAWLARTWHGTWSCVLPRPACSTSRRGHGHPHVVSDVPAAVVDAAGPCPDSSVLQGLQVGPLAQDDACTLPVLRAQVRVQGPQGGVQPDERRAARSPGRACGGSRSALLRLGSAARSERHAPVCRGSPSSSGEKMNTKARWLEVCRAAAAAAQRAALSCTRRSCRSQTSWAPGPAAPGASLARFSLGEPAMLQCLRLAASCRRGRREAHAGLQHAQLAERRGRWHAGPASGRAHLSRAVSMQQASLGCFCTTWPARRRGQPAVRLLFSQVEATWADFCSLHCSGLAVQSHVWPCMACSWCTCPVQCHLPVSSWPWPHLTSSPDTCCRPRRKPFTCAWPAGPALIVCCTAARGAPGRDGPATTGIWPAKGGARPQSGSKGYVALHAIQGEGACRGWTGGRASHVSARSPAGRPPAAPTPVNRGREGSKGAASQGA